MQKVLILSYFFPPANFVGGERAAGWAEYFHENNIYPIIITRNWNDNQKDLVDKVSDNEYKVEKSDFYEVHRLPYKRSFRDVISKYKWLKVLQKFLTLKELILSNFFVSSLPYSNFYFKAKEILLNDSNIKGVIISGRPFNSFFIGYKLKKQFDILWIPDYRDEWTTNQVVTQDSFLQRFIYNRELKSEIRWTSNASFFTTVSGYGLKRIQSQINIKGFEVKNGYDQLNDCVNHHGNAEVFSIAYIGTLYAHQKIELFIDAFIELKKEFPDESITCTFIGVEILEDQLIKLEKLIAKAPKSFKILPRIKKEQLAKDLSNYDLFLATNYENFKGVLPVKIFNYFASGISTLLYPSDNGVMADFINETNSGYVISSKEDCISTLRKLIEDKKNGININKEHNYELGKLYSRKHQTQLLSNVINDYL